MATVTPSSNTRTPNPADHIKTTPSTAPTPAPVDTLNGGGQQATRHRYAVRGYISTAAKHGVSVFTALRDALTGNPWMPPIPAGA